MCLVWCACVILTHKGKNNKKKSHYRIVTRWGYSIDLVSILLIIISRILELASPQLLSG